MKKILRFAFLGLAVAASASAQSPEFPAGVPETFRIRLGGFFANLETRVSAQPIGSPNQAVIDYENELGFPDAKTAFRADASWRFARKWSLDAGFVTFSRSGERTITRDIEFEDEVFELGTTLQAGFDSTNIYGAVRWDFIKTENLELGASLGVDYFKLENTVTGQVRINDVLITRNIVSDFNAPVPVIGAQVTGVIAPKVTIGGYIRFLAINIEEAEGSVTDAAGRVDWYPWKNVGVGLSYDWVDLDLERLEYEGFEYSFQYKYNGPRIFAILSF